MNDFYEFYLYFLLSWSSNIALNLLYVFKRYIPKLKPYDYPLDFGKSYYGNRLIGDSVTIPGLILCLVMSGILYLFFTWSIWIIIPLLVFIGDMLGSFIKRRFKKKNGEYMPFVDHGNYMIITGIILVSFKNLKWEYAILGILLTYILHPIACAIAYRLKLRELPY